MTDLTDGMIEDAARELAVTPWDIAPDDLKRVIRHQARRVLSAALTSRVVDPAETETDEGAALRMARSRQWIAHKGTGYLPPWDGLTPVEQEQVETEARHWIQAAVNTGVKIVPPGCTIVQLPEPDGAALSGAPRWDASARRILAKVDDQGRPFIRLDGQTWLVEEAESIGLALVAAAREARRLAEVTDDQSE